MSDEFWGEMFASATRGDTLDLEDYSLRHCPLCPPPKKKKDGTEELPKLEMMHKDDRFCKKCKKSGKNEEAVVYNINHTK